MRPRKDEESVISRASYAFLQITVENRIITTYFRMRRSNIAPEASHGRIITSAVNQKPKVRVSKKRTVTMYVEMWQGSEILLRRAQSDTAGNYWVLMSALLLTAFTFESYLNHIGPQLFKSWNALERLGPLEKLEIVCEKFGISFPPGERPLQSIVTLFKFRNDLAHGKDEVLSTSELRDNETMHTSLGEQPKAKWEKTIAWETVKQLRADLEQVIRKLHVAADPEGDPVFSPGSTMTSAKLES